MFILYMRKIFTKIYLVQVVAWFFFTGTTTASAYSLVDVYAKVYILHKGQLMEHHDRATNQNNGNRELKDHQALSK